MKKVYEYQWFKPYLVKLPKGRTRFYKPTTEFLTKIEANKQGIYHPLIETRKERTI